MRSVQSLIQVEKKTLPHSQNKRWQIS